MEKEISSGTMLGIVLIALAAVIGLGFGVFSIAKGVANEGTVGVQDNLNTVTDSAFEDYNDKIVTGTQVKSAIQNFEGKSVAILVNTTAMNKGVKSYANRATGFGPYALYVNGLPYVNYNALLSHKSDGSVNTRVGVGAIIKGAASLQPILNDDGSSTAYSATGPVGGPKLKDGVITTSSSFALDTATGKVLFDYAIGGMSRTGNCEYVSTSSKFEANLIRDTSGTNIGILFTQLAQ